MKPLAFLEAYGSHWQGAESRAPNQPKYEGDKQLKWKKLAVIGLMPSLPAGCASEGSTCTGLDLNEQTKTLRDGREVTCIVYMGYSKGSLSCDWESVKKSGK